MSEKKLKKKVVDPCPNRLFVSWITELKRVAKNKNDKSYFSYKKALRSIKKFSLPFKSGKDCIILDGFGEKICAVLDAKLYELATSQGLTISKALRRGNRELSKKYFKSQKSGSSQNLTDGENSDANVIDSVPMLDRNERKKFDEPKRKRQKMFTIEENSDSYYLLKSLLSLENNEVQNGNQCGYLKKNILDVASTFYIREVDEPYKQYIWTYMKKLVKENLVNINGKYYRITEIGKGALNGVTENKETAISSVSKTVEKSQGTLTQPSIINSNGSSLNNIEFYYIKSLEVDKHERVYLKSEAAFKTHNDKKYFRIQVKYENLSALSLLNLDFMYEFESLRQSSDKCFVFIADTHAPSYCSFSDEFTIPSANLKAKPIVKINPSVGKPIEFSYTDVQQSNEIADPVMYSMAPNSFEIILIVDNRECFGTGQFKQIICQKLQQNGIKFENRVLSIGDFLWIARDLSGREAVINILIERKKFDDLSSSIIDGRFADQKSRMVKSGISKLILLIEKCSSMNNVAISIDTLYQAVVNSQVNDNFEIKISENGAATIAYITWMTRKICTRFKNHFIDVYDKCVPKSVASNNPFDDTINRLPAIDFTSFSNSLQKTKPLKVSEMFGKHLMCIYGVSPERAKAITLAFPVPRLLISAYAAQSTEKERRELISKFSLPYSSGTIGINVSKSVHAAYTRV